MDLFTYLMAKNGNNSSVHGDLFSYLLGKGQSQTQTISGVTIYIPNAKKLVSFMMTKESTQATSILPSEYTQVDYIKSSKTQYIDTNYYTNSNTSIELTLKFDNAISEFLSLPPNVFISSCNQENSSDSFIYLNSGNASNSYKNLYIWTRLVGKQPTTSITNMFDNLRDKSTIIMKNGVFTCKNTTINYLNLNDTSTTPLTLFGGKIISDNDDLVKPFSTWDMYLYDFKIYENNILVKHYIPCYRNSDNEVGLYEIINGEFFTNQGTGAFTYGSVAQLPNPDYPQEVKTVKGYRNLFDEDNVTFTVGTLDENGQPTSSTASHYTNEYYDVLPNTNFTINGTLRTSTTQYAIYFYNKNKEWISKTSPTSLIPFTFTTPNNCYYIRIQVIKQITLKTHDVMLNEGTETLPYVPYGNNYIAYKQVGKNLLEDMTAYNVLGASTYYRANSLTPITSPYTTSGGYRGVGFVAPVKAGVTYVFSSDISNVSVRGASIYSQISDITNSNNQLEMFAGTNTFTPTYDGYALIVFLTATSGTTMTWSHAQLEVGTTATEYEAHKETTTIIPLNNNELVGIGNYKDELLVDKSGHVFINKKTLIINSNNINSIALYGTGTSNYFYRLLFTTPAIDSNLSLCSHYQNKSITTSNTNQGFHNYENEIRVRYGEEQDKTIFGTWLEDNNVTFYLPRKTPELIDLQTTVDLKLFKGVNNVSNSEDGYMTIEYR